MKPKIIEIMGAPGVGKSTIYKSLCRSWDPGSPWVYPDVLLTSRPGFYSFRKWVMYRLRLLLHKKLTKSIPVDYGMRFGVQQQELAKFCWRYLTDQQLYNDEEVSKSFRSAYFLFSTFCTYQAIFEKAPVKPCVVEEGLLQKSFFIKDDEDDDEMMDELLSKYLQLVPLPYAVIYIDTPDINEIVKRLRGRNKIIASHFDKDDAALRQDIKNWQRMHNSMLEKLKSAGVLIVRINGKHAIKKNVSRIKELLKNIDDAGEARLVDFKNGSALAYNETYSAGLKKL